jgi:hypothetical protein
MKWVESSSISKNKPRGCPLTKTRVHDEERVTAPEAASISKASFSQLSITIKKKKRGGEGS